MWNADMVGNREGVLHFMGREVTIRFFKGGMQATKWAVANLQGDEWGCAKGAEKASCAETVVQKGVFGESVSSGDKSASQSSMELY